MLKRRTRRAALALLLVATAATGSVERAQADVSSWAAVSPGVSLRELGQPDAQQGALLQLEAGIGSSPYNPVVLGIVARSLTHFGAGTDWVLAQRTATSGFARGTWGGALDLGVHQRWWGEDTTGGSVTLTAGAPWGINLSVTGAMGTGDARMVTVALGIDWARLTAHRSVGHRWWKNYELPREQQARR